MQIRKDLTVENVENELVVLDLDGGQVHSLNAAACIVWQGVAAGCSAEDIVITLCEKFDVTQSVAADDVERVLQDLIRLGLVEA